MLFNEPKLLKFIEDERDRRAAEWLSVLFNEPKLLKSNVRAPGGGGGGLSVLFNEPKLLKFAQLRRGLRLFGLSVLFNEPKLLKFFFPIYPLDSRASFSALQRAEIAEIGAAAGQALLSVRFQCSSTSRNC